MNAKAWFKKNRSSILSVVACIGVAATGVLTYFGTIKAQKTIKEWTEEKRDELTAFEKVQASVKPLAPAVGAAIGTMACIAGAQEINKRDLAVVTGGAVAAAKRYDDYRKANIEVNGKDAHERVVKKLAVQEAKQANLSSETWWTITSLNSALSKEKFLFHDKDLSGQYFDATMAQVLDAMYCMNHNLVSGHPEVDVQMWCDFVGIENKNKDTRGWVLGDDFNWIGFNISDPVEIEDGVKVLTITVATSPIPHYQDYDPMDDCYYDDDGNRYELEDVLKDDTLPF